MFNMMLTKPNINYSHRHEHAKERMDIYNPGILQSTLGIQFQLIRLNNEQ
jgi:hypothetical protein